MRDEARLENSFWGSDQLRTGSRDWDSMRASLRWDVRGDEPIIR